MLALLKNLGGSWEASRDGLHKDLEQIEIVLNRLRASTFGTGTTLPPSSGGSGTTTIFTQGSVIFAGSGGVYSQDNANFFWDDTNNRLGIGTTTPAANLHVFESTNTFDVVGRLQNAGTNANSGAALDLITGSVVGRWFVAGQNATDPRVEFGAASSHPLVFMSVNTEIARLAFVGAGDALLTLGGTTAGFPALRRNAATLDIRLADNSAPAALNLGYAHITTAGSNFVNIGELSGVPTFSGIAITGTSAAVTTSNYNLLGDSTNTYLNAPGGGVLFFRVGNTTQAQMTSIGWFVGTGGTPTARLHLAAGTTGTSPFKFTSGTSLTTAEAGALEFTTDDFFATITTGAARKAFILDDGTRLTSGKIPVATTNGRLIDGPTQSSLSTISATIALTNQVADIGTTNFANAGTVGTYRVSYSLQDTTSDITAGAVTLTIAWTDSAGATTSTAVQVLTGVGRTSGVIYIQLASGNVTYATSHTGIFGTAKYALYATCERLS